MHLGRNAARRVKKLIVETDLVIALLYVIVWPPAARAPDDGKTKKRDEEEIDKVVPLRPVMEPNCAAEELAAAVRSIMANDAKPIKVTTDGGRA